MRAVVHDRYGPPDVLRVAEWNDPCRNAMNMASRAGHILQAFPEEPSEGASDSRALVTTFLTLDGVMQAPGGPKEDDSGGFAHGGWSVNYWDDLVGEVMNEATSKPFAMVLGRRTYDIMAAFWPTAPEEAGAKTFNEATKYVASRGHLTLDEWSNSVLIEGDAATASPSSSRITDPSCKCTAARTWSRRSSATTWSTDPPVGLPGRPRLRQAFVRGRRRSVCA